MTVMAPDGPDARERRPLPARLLGIGARGAERVAAVAGIDEAVEGATEAAIVRALESPAVERAAVRVLDSELVDHVWDRLLASDEAQKLVERIAEAPEVRAAIASQGFGLVDDLGRQISEIAGRLDNGLERVMRRLLRRPRRTEPARGVGLVTRALAFVLDGAIVNGGFLVLAAVLTALFGGDGVSQTGFLFGTGAWMIAVSTYLLTFWSLAGQTPGMRFLSIRIDADGSPRLGLRRARRRLAGLVLAALPFGLGFLGVVTRDDRRGFHDRHAGTEVRRVERVAAPWSRGSDSE